jgi:MFS family permease
VAQRALPAEENELLPLPADGAARRGLGPFEPLREPSFRNIWLASILSNFGHLILGVGAAWEMTRLAGSPEMVALVQTALMLPLMLVAVPGGAVADMFDRRKVAMAGLAIASFFASMLTLISLAGLATPYVLLAACFLIGAGVALYNPAWGASIAEQVKPAQLPQAVALGSISYNVARSVGPAVGGLIVLAFGASAAFATNAVAYLPLLVAFYLWRRRHVPPRLPPERIDRAIVAGARYAIHSTPVRSAMIRALAFGISGAALAALAPLVARDLLGGDAGIYGLLLGATGVGAVLGALLVGPVRERMPVERAYALCVLLTAVMVVVVGMSRNVVLTVAAVTLVGAANMLSIALLNVVVQTSVPRWVAARALSLFQASITGGMAAGAVFWGHVAASWGLEAAFLASAGAFLLTALLGTALRLPQVSTSGLELVGLREDPEVELAITSRSGPIIVEIDYRVDPENARDFYGAMLKLQRARRRNGAFGWSLSRDIADRSAWTERFHCPTWGDYLRLRSRMTSLDHALQAAAAAFQRPGVPVTVRRQLERPFGSVRRSAESLDPQGHTIGILTP